MLKGVNDSPADARALVRLIAGIPAKINLIPFNPWPGAPFECSDWPTIERFGDIVNAAGYAARSARRAAATSSPPAASSRARASGCGRACGRHSLAPRPPQRPDPRASSFEARYAGTSG